jgi:hypothetical protein
MRETRTSGSEGGGNETNRRSLPLSVNTDREYWIARSSPAMTPELLDRSRDENAEEAPWTLPAVD